MSFLTMLDHRAVIYRATPSRDRFGGILESWVALPSPKGKNARPNQTLAGNLTNPGPGEIQAANNQWFLHPDFDVRERDVLKVVSGPESPAHLRVVAVARPTNAQAVHHLEVMVEPWVGPLP